MSGTVSSWQPSSTKDDLRAYLAIAQPACTGVFETQKGVYIKIQPAGSSQVEHLGGHLQHAPTAMHIH